MEWFFSIFQQVEITILDVNEPPAKLLLSGSKSLDAKAEPGQLIGQLSAEDPDLGQQLIFSAVGANSDIVRVTQTNLLTVKAPIPQVLLLQKPPVLHVIIQVTDNGSPPMTFTEQFDLEIKNIDDSLLPNLVLNPGEIFDNATVGSTIATVEIYNSIKSLGDLEYILIGDADGLFGLVNSDLILLRSVSHNKAPSHQITVHVKSASNPDVTLTESLTIFILATHDCPGGCPEFADCIDDSCVCTEGYFKDGDECSKIDDCESNPCMTGTCVDEVDGFKCKCEERFSGPLCEVEDQVANPCSPQPCRNSGACISEDVNKYRCACTQGWEGDHCDVSVDDCADAICYEQSQCIDKHLTYICQCPDGYEGLRCEFQTGSCEADPCLPSEICVPKFADTGYFCAYDTDQVTLPHPDVSNDTIAQFLDFFYNVIELFMDAPKTKNQPRRKRDIEDSKVYMYILSTDDDTITFVLATKDGFFYTQEEVLDYFLKGCQRIGEH